MSNIGFAMPVITKILIFFTKTVMTKLGSEATAQQIHGQAEMVCLGSQGVTVEAWEVLLGSFSILSTSGTVTSVEGQQDLLLKGWHCVWPSGRVGRDTHSSCSPHTLLTPAPSLLSCHLLILIFPSAQNSGPPKFTGITTSHTLFNTPL